MAGQPHGEQVPGPAGGPSPAGGGGAQHMLLLLPLPASAPGRGTPAPHAVRSSVCLSANLAFFPPGSQVMVVHAGAELSPERLVSPAELAAVRAGRRV